MNVFPAIHTPDAASPDDVVGLDAASELTGLSWWVLRNRALTTPGFATKRDRTWIFSRQRLIAFAEARRALANA